ncbi:uncharacterized protein LOC142786379 [Rhipicephalus microplus]|uniref:uncharacterized protein LOC142786379 n=1 Tax=Rhipicephalus microplus TaxID=6941 RepID=UPI003F6C737C
MQMTYVHTFSLFLLWPTIGCSAKSCKNACAKVLCPGILQPEQNSYLENAPMDPELEDVLTNINKQKENSACIHVWCPKVQLPCLNTWITNTSVDPEAITTPAPQDISEKATQPTSTKLDDTEEHRDVTSLSFDSAGGWDIGCSNANTHDGMGCLLFYWSKGRSTRSCMVGKCVRRRCVPHRLAECATS